MIVSHTNRFIFLKTPKTAGTSIQNALKSICEYPDVVTYGHINQITGENASPLSEFATMQELPNQISYFSFGFTRNPWSLALSRYMYQIKRGRLPDFYKPEKLYFKLWVISHYAQDYITDKTETWLFEDGKQTVQFIGKYENLQKDFRYICNIIGCGMLELEHYNKSQVYIKNYRDWYGDESKLLICKMFEFEIDTFKYTF